jgi:predicted RNA binding protein YcfA (HicA-like mRNA interferase family)
MVALKIISCLIILKLFSLIDLVYDTFSDQKEDQVTIFNGKNLEGWTGTLQNWRVEDGQLIGATRSKKDPDQAQWIVTEEEYDDFELTLWVKLDGDGNRNSGVYYRGEWNDEGQVVGYEFDLGGWGGEKELWWGELHDPYRRDMWITLLEKEEVIRLYNKKGWNHVRIRAEGSHIQHWLNGVKTVDWHEKDASIKKIGFIGFQLHNESKFEVRIRDISLIQIK